MNITIDLPDFEYSVHRGKIILDAEVVHKNPTPLKWYFFKIENPSNEQENEILEWIKEFGSTSTNNHCSKHVEAIVKSACDEFGKPLEQRTISVYQHNIRLFLEGDELAMAFKLKFAFDFRV